MVHVGGGGSWHDECISICLSQVGVSGGEEIIKTSIIIEGARIVKCESTNHAVVKVVQQYRRDRSACRRCHVL